MLAILNSQSPLYVGCEEGAINIYGTVYSFLHKFEEEKQICSSWKPSSDVVMFHLLSVQRQLYGSHCGLFAAANATELAYGYEPLKCNWATDCHQEHSYNCTEKKTIQQFPKKTQK